MVRSALLSFSRPKIECEDELPPPIAVDRRAPPTRHPRPVDHPQRTAEDQQQPSRTGTPTRRIYRTHIRGEHAFPLHNHTQRRKHELISTRNQNRQLKSLAELSQLIRVKAQHIDRLPLHQLLSTINQAINLTSSVDGLYRLLNRALPMNSSPFN